jgi:hypothetical protein
LDSLTPSDAVSQWRAGLIYVTRDMLMSTTVTVIAPRLQLLPQPDSRKFSVPPRYSYCTATKASKSPDRIFAAAPGISSVSSPKNKVYAAELLRATAVASDTAVAPIV